MRHLRLALLLHFALTLGASSPKIDPTHVSEAVISYMPWSVLTRIRQSPERIRSNPPFKFIVSDGFMVQKLIRNLPIDSLKPNSEGPGDIRLVIDFKMKDGTLQSYCASQFYFYSGDQKLRIEPNARFFQLFSLDQLPLLQ
jgi:hypothetical protein